MPFKPSKVYSDPNEISTTVFTTPKKRDAKRKRKKKVALGAALTCDEKLVMQSQLK